MTEIVSPVLLLAPYLSSEISFAILSCLPSNKDPRILVTGNKIEVR